MRPLPVPANQRGMSMLWIVALVALIMTFLTVGVRFIEPKVKQAQATATQRQLDSAFRAIVGFAVSNRRLPTAVEFNSLMQDSTDVWGTPLVYLYDGNFTQPPDICGRLTATMSVASCGTDANCTTPTTAANVPFALLSGGAIRGNSNVIFQSYSTGTSGAVGSGAVVRYFSPNTTVGTYGAPATNLQPYDDQIRFADVSTLRQALGCYYNQLRIVNTEMPSGKTAVAYSGGTYAEGGVPFSSGGRYRWCLEQVPSQSNGTLPPGVTSPAPLQNPGAQTCQTLPESSWYQGDSLPLSGTPTTGNVYYVNFWVRDNNDPVSGNDNFASKILPIKIVGTTPPGGGTCFNCGWPGSGAGLFMIGQSGPNTVTVNPNGSVDLVNSHGNATACFWFPTALPTNGTFVGSTMRAYFNFMIYQSNGHADSGSYSEDMGDGFTFTLLPGAAAAYLRQAAYGQTLDLCGDATKTGYEGGTIASQGYSPNLAIEVDGFGQPIYNDPSNSANHVAVLTGSLTHGVTAAGTSTPSATCGTTSTSSCYYYSTSHNPNWLEESQSAQSASPHGMRVEVQTLCNSNCSACGVQGGGYALVNAWIDCVNCSSIASAYTATPSNVQYCAQVPAAMANQIVIGFTSASAGTSLKGYGNKSSQAQTINVSNFAVGFY